MSCDLVTGICVAPPTVSCVPPMLWRINRCECPAGGPARTVEGALICSEPPRATTPPVCTVTLAYAPNDPNGVQVTKPEGCDAAGIELAVAVALARLLGAQ